MFELPESELAELAAYDWPGTARVLRNMIERAVILSRGGILRPSVLLASTQPVTHTSDYGDRVGAETYAA
ncbi:MAG: hypothetical protein N2595_04065 [bacterium]|nr:hypothetical protein [bacterium]